MADVETAPRKNADLPVRLASAVVMLALAVSAIVIGGTVFDTFVVIVALIAFVEFVLLVVGATANIPYRLAAIIAGAVYFGLAGGVLVGAGDFLIILIIGATVFTDTFAYFSGRAFGRHKLAPSISPGKTWEGAISGFIGVFVLAACWLWADAQGMSSANSLYARLWAFGPLLAVLSLAFLVAMSVVGDLVESLVKRSAGVKDSSGLLPGHGGVLDRVDALLPVLPLAMMLTTL